MAMRKHSPITFNTDDLMTIDEAAKELNVHLATCYRWLENGKLTKIRIGKSQFFVSTTEVERLKEAGRLL